MFDAFEGNAQSVRFAIECTLQSIQMGPSEHDVTLHGENPVQTIEKVVSGTADLFIKIAGDDDDEPYVIDDKRSSIRLSRESTCLSTTPKHEHSIHLHVV